MLVDKERTMCQDVTPNTAESKSMMYAITWNDAGDKMIQVGIEPVRLIEELRSNEISEVVANMPIYEGIDIMVADKDTLEIYGSTDESFIGGNLTDIGIADNISSSKTAVNQVLKIDGKRTYCSLEKTGDYIVLVAYAATTNAKSFFVSMVIEFFYLLLAGMVITYMFRKVIRANNERNAQMAVLESVADIYNSMHLIDLNADTIIEYNARDEVSDAVDYSSENGAAQTMEKLMVMTTDEEYLDEALSFTDLTTIQERMKDRRVMSDELVSNAIGWYRGSFITTEADAEGRPVKLIYVTQDIDKQKKKEEELLYKSHADQLTGLFNRRAYEDSISEYGEHVKEKNFVFVSLDVNGLKTVNDTLGHSAGDELLIGASECMKRCFGPYGRVYRTGGDEFVAMIFASGKQLEDIKKDFETVTGSWRGKRVKRLTISTGYVTNQETKTSTVHEMAELADKRMYEAKEKYYEERPEERRRTGL
jgi:diguanylate cyclase (GGDEF)-like protein